MCCRLYASVELPASLIVTPLPRAPQSRFPLASACPLLALLSSSFHKLRLGNDATGLIAHPDNLESCVGTSDCRPKAALVLEYIRDRSPLRRPARCSAPLLGRHLIGHVHEAPVRNTVCNITLGPGYPLVLSWSQKWRRPQRLPMPLEGFLDLEMLTGMDPLLGFAFLIFKRAARKDTVG